MIGNYTSSSRANVRIIRYSKHPKILAQKNKDRSVLNIKKKSDDIVFKNLNLSKRQIKVFKNIEKRISQRKIERIEQAENEMFQIYYNKERKKSEKKLKRKE